MSQAFVKEQEEQWLHEVQPTLAALLNHLTRENNGIRVNQLATQIDKKTNREVYSMSNGLGYTKDEEGRWMIH